MPLIMAWQIKLSSGDNMWEFIYEALFLFVGGFIVVIIAMKMLEMLIKAFDPEDPWKK